MKGIKKVSSILTVIFTISLLTLMSCDGGGGGTGGKTGPGGTGGGTSGDNSLLTTVSGTIVGWGDKSKAPASCFVVAVIIHEEEGEDGKETVFDAECSTRGTVGDNGSFSITLNSSLDDEYLSLASANSHVADCDFDPEDMEGTWNYDVEFYVYASTKTPGSDSPDFSIVYAVDDTENANSAGLMYNSTKGTISGSTTQIDNWNEDEEEGGDIDDGDATPGETIAITSTENNNLDVTLYTGWNWIIFDVAEDWNYDQDANTADNTRNSDISSSTYSSLEGYKWYIEQDDK